jgi:peptidoglycan/LPS O-acetylase OafA/YrhL
VVFDHMSTMVLQPARDFLYQWFNGGQYGVFVFFLVSGYIIPASLERKGSVRGFWVSRAFRLYPLYLLAIVASVAAWRLGLGPIHGAASHPLTWMSSQLLMMSNMLSGPNVPNVVWTLSYEMVFYLLLTALFTFRIHRHSAGYAVGAAIAAVVLGGILPLSALNHSALGPRKVALLADIIILVGLALAVSGRRLPRAAGAALAAVAGLTLLLFNQSYPYAWSGLTILALMFTGTMLYRAERGEFGRGKAAVIAVAVFALTVAAGLWHSQAWHLAPASARQWDFQWVSSLVLAGATFGVGMALRHRKVPAALAWLGLVSYSVYLLHPIVLNAYRTIPVLHRSHPVGVQVLLAAGIVAILLAGSWLTYRFVEAPMQRYGHRAARVLQARFGPDQPGGAAPGPGASPDPGAAPVPAPEAGQPLGPVSPRPVSPGPGALDGRPGTGADSLLVHGRRSRGRADVAVPEGRR